MEDFFGEMTETEISKYKFNRVAKCLSIPPWQTAYAIFYEVYDHANLGLDCRINGKRASTLRLNKEVS